MQALHDDERVATLEQKIDKGFAETRAQIVSSERETRAQIVSSERALRVEIDTARSDARSDCRTSLAVMVGMWVATVLAVVEILLNHS
jgi:hypothetical protein